MAMPQPKAISAKPAENSTDAKQRIVWVDIARGLAICLVVLHHSVLAAVKVGELGEAVSRVNGLLLHLRMPLFFFCSGLLASWCITKPWSAVLLNRGLVLVWLILLWTVLYFGLQQFIPVNPWTVAPDPRHLFITPYVTLWFIYAILLLTLLMKALAARSLVMQVLVVLALHVPLVLIYKGFEDQLVGTSIGLWQLINVLGRFALLYFAAGCWLAPMVVALFRDGRRVLVLFPLAVFIWVAEVAGPHVLQLDFALPRLLAGIPAVFLGMAFAALLALWTPTRTVFGWIGTRTLEIFLFHSVLIGLAFMLVEPLGITSGTTALLLFVGFGLLGSIACERAASLVKVPFLFRPPERVREYARSLLARLAPRFDESRNVRQGRLPSPLASSLR